MVAGRVDEVCCDTARQDEGGGDGGGDNDVFYEFRVSDTHMWRRGSSSHKCIMGLGAARRGESTTELYTAKNVGSRAKNSQNSWVEQNTAENEEGGGRLYELH